MIGAVNMLQSILPAFFATDEYENWHSKCSLCPQLKRVRDLSCFNSSKQTKQISTSVFSAMTNLINYYILNGPRTRKFCFYAIGPPQVHIYLCYVFRTLPFSLLSACYDFSVSYNQTSHCPLIGQLIQLP